MKKERIINRQCEFFISFHSSFTWLGFNDIQKEQTFKWSDGSNSSFFYWASDEEKDDRMNEMEDCAAMGRDGQWRQFNCENRFYAFCKKRIRKSCI